MIHDRVLSIDPSLRCFGIAAWEGPSLFQAVAIVTEREAKKRRIYVGDDDCRRLGDIENALKTFRDNGFVDVVMEMPAGSQSYRGAKSEGMMLGLVIGVFGLGFCSFVQARDVKKMVAGSYTADKDDMVRWAKEHYPLAFEEKLSRPKQEAIADALAVMVTHRGSSRCRLLATR